MLSNQQTVKYALQAFEPQRNFLEPSTKCQGCAGFRPEAGAFSLRCAGAALNRQSPIGASRLPAPVLYSSSPLTVRLRWRMTGSRACRRSRRWCKPGGSRRAELRPALGIDARLRHGTGTMYSRRSGQVGLDLVPRGGFDGESDTSRPRFFELPISKTGASSSCPRSRKSSQTP